jgi:hypothetical protein
MPQPSFHLQLSSEILTAWAAAPGTSPFDPFDTRNRTAFLHGSLGPDMGFFPGSVLMLSRLAHRDPTADLVRELLRQAHNERALAFGCGWAGHILLDAILHPAINAAAARRLGVCLSEAPPAQIEHAHIRLEIGLDLQVQRSHPALPRLRLDPVFDAGGLEFVTRALASVHGRVLPELTVVAAHRRVSQILGPMLALQAAMAFARTDGAEGTLTPAILSMRAGLGTLQMLATSVKGRSSKTAAFLAPLQPDAELTSQVSAGVARFRREFQSHAERGFATLPNYNVDDGSIAAVSYGESAA